MALGFGLGASLFALGTVLVWLSVSDVAISVVFATGALLFTSAAYLQWRTAKAHAPKAPDAFWEQIKQNLSNPDWSSAAIQLVGTFYFNVMTIRALVLSLGHSTISDRGVWHPDFVGSALFLIASWVAWHPIARERRHRLLYGRSKWINTANMMGSVLFALSAWGALPIADDMIRNVPASNWGTFLGAISFLIAAALMWPPKTSAATSATSQLLGGDKPAESLRKPA
jgi:hypothetical protein